MMPVNPPSSPASARRPVAPKRSGGGSRLAGHGSPVTARRSRLAGHGSPLNAARGTAEKLSLFQANSRASQTPLVLPRFAPAASVRRLIHLGWHQPAPRDPRFAPVRPNHSRPTLVLPGSSPNQPGATLVSPRFVQIRPAQGSLGAGGRKSGTANRRFTPVGRSFCRLTQKPAKIPQICEKTGSLRTPNC